jgi:hypothetical protein
VADEEREAVSETNKAEQREQLKELVREVLQEQREQRISMQEKTRAETEIGSVEKLFLITVLNRIAIPDAKGRAICTETVYARRNVVTKNGSEVGDFLYGNSRVTVVAYGDGRLLKEPLVVLISGNVIAAMVEVPESILSNLKEE